jgi:predicted metal-dependent phosphotriesterase family hydrolase
MIICTGLTGTKKIVPGWPDIDKSLYAHIFDDVLPALPGRGASEARINQVMVKNPQRIFERQGKH